MVRGLREVAETIILALLIFLLVRAVVQNFQVEGQSMQPTFQDEWYLLVNKMLYAEINLNTINKFLPFIDPGDDPTRHVFRAPRRGDVIVFRAPKQSPSQPERDFIKRIIAVGGETVEVHDCTVFINGQPLDEPYIPESQKPLYEYGPETVPPEHYFVLGDNRNGSSDSHNHFGIANHSGMLPKENIIGQAWLIYWPSSAFGLVDNTSVTPGAGAQDSTESGAGKLAPACS
jgi:signal peptidase I